MLRYWKCLIFSKIWLSGHIVRQGESCPSYLGLVYGLGLGGFAYTALFVGLLSQHSIFTIFWLYGQYVSVVLTSVLTYIWCVLGINCVFSWSLWPVATCIGLGLYILRVMFPGFRCAILSLDIFISAWYHVIFLWCTLSLDLYYV